MFQLLVRLEGNIGMSRSLKKGPFTDEKLLKKIRALKPGDRTIVKTWSRASMITPDMVKQ